MEQVVGKAVIVKAVNVGGSNYVKLRDLEKLARVSVDFVDGVINATCLTV